MSQNQGLHLICFEVTIIKMSTPFPQFVILVPFQPKCSGDLLPFGRHTKNILNFILKSNKQEELRKLVHSKDKIYGQISERGQSINKCFRHKDVV